MYNRQYKIGTSLFLMTILFFACVPKTLIQHHPPLDLQAYWADYFYRTLGVGISGYAYAIYKDGLPLAQGADGFAIIPQTGFPDGVPMSLDTRIQIASCSKPITATALLHVLQERNLSVHTSIWDILQERFEQPGKMVDQITISDLLKHTSGYNFGYIETPYFENAAILLSKDVPNQPGNTYRYSNINTALARLILEVLSGEDYEEYVRQNILTPCGINDMKLKIKPEEAIYVYRYGERFSLGMPMNIDFSDEAAAYGWYASGNELIKFLEAVRNASFLSEEKNDEMLNNGLGWGVKETVFGKVFSHDGQWVIENNVGVRTHIGLYPDNVVAVLLMNTNGPFFPGKLVMDGMKNLYPEIVHRKKQHTDSAYVHFKLPLGCDHLKWTLDGTYPHSNAQHYHTGVKVQTPVTIKVTGFYKGAASTLTSSKQLE